MAIVDKGLKIDLSPALVPDGYVADPYELVSDYEYIREYELSVLRATVENTDKAVTFGNIIDNATMGIKKQVNDLVSADFVSGNTVEYSTELTDLTSNVQRSKSNDFYSNIAMSFVCKVTVKIKTT